VVVPSTPVAEPAAGSTPAADAAETRLLQEKKAETELALQEQQAVEKLCDDISALYRRNKWGASNCARIPFRVFGRSVQGRPLVYFEAGAPTAKKVTILQCGIHGDELPSLPMCLNLIEEIRSGRRGVAKPVRLFVQPLLNPDGMLGAKATRQNANGVDINRNFPTKDFAEKALASWKTLDKGDARKFPGNTPSSEPETRAIVDFLAQHSPQKIISLHTPLGFIDLDARGDADAKRRAQYLAINMSKNAGNYKFKTFGSYPGSLGNYAGNERKIPVYTVELPPGTGPHTVDEYWKRFRVSLWRAVDFDLETGQFIEED